jgi:hypothetical protein
MTHISNALPKHKNKAPSIPSVVFLGDRLGAKRFFPKRFPKSKPPLSACQERQKTIAINFGLKGKKYIKTY